VGTNDSAKNRGQEFVRVKRIPESLEWKGVTLGVHFVLASMRLLSKESALKTLYKHEKFYAKKYQIPLDFH
jgi:hypothetical protein